jgi:hypothetical protein
MSLQQAMIKGSRRIGSPLALVMAQVLITETPARATSRKRLPGARARRPMLRSYDLQLFVTRSSSPCRRAAHVC